MKFVLIILATLSTALCSAQSNLIENGNLEIPNSFPCSGSFYFLDSLKNIWNPINTSPDYLHRCNISLPFSSNSGYQEDYLNENGYIGIATYSQFDTTYREFIMLGIKSTLEINKKYKFKLMVCNSDFNLFSTNIGCCFEKDSVNGLVQNNFIPTYPEYTFMSDSIIRDCSKWTEVSFELIPNIDGLKYIVIGAFPETKPLLLENHSLVDFCSTSTSLDPNFAYYLIDDIRLYCLDCDTNELCEAVCPDAFTPNNDGLNDSWKPMIQNDCYENIYNYLLRIFDRWGNVVFTSYDKNTAWSASSNELGTYIYYLQYDDNLQTQIKQGSLELIR
ncbi:MAG: gliding motility-associated C-terminal domain-containing protein [Bacteroidota bacterium]